MQFVFQPLTWGFLLVLVPLLVHLINLLRHRRQRWAAMEFLLESYRKHRRWVWMKQLLLLLSRMAIMAVLVAMLAQWVSGARWLSMFGQTITHHYVLLDDSLSMGDTAQGTSAYQVGLRAIAGLLQSVADDQDAHQVTILRYSRALNIASASKAAEGAAIQLERPADTAADILSRTVPSNPSSLLETLNRTSPVSVDLSPIGAIQLVTPLIRNASNERANVYLVSDFREKDWRQSQSIRSALEPLKAAQAEVHLLDCAPTARENLTLVSLQPDQEILAAGVPLMMKLEVRNAGVSPIRNVNVTVKLFDFAGETIEPQPDRFASGRETQLPPVVIDMIAPGETVSRRIQVIFSEAGSHVVQATLPEDALTGDNSIGCVLDVTEGQRLLVIDGDESRRGWFFLNATLNPGGLTRTGWKPVAETMAFLRDSAADALDAFAVIALINVRSLDPRAIANLEAYVRKGGGVAVVMGGTLSKADIDRFNRDWFRDGEGLLPQGVEAVVELPTAESAAAGPDMIPANHPIFASLMGLSNSPFQFVRVSRYVRLKEPLRQEESRKELVTRRSAQTIATLRDGAPLMVDYGFGNGRVVVLTTTFDPQWTTWPQDPTFVVAMLKMVGYLASFRAVETSSMVATPIDWQFSSREMLPEVNILLGRTDRNLARMPLTVNAVPLTEPTLAVHLEVDPTSQSDEMVQAFLSPGITELWSNSLQGARVVKNFARNAPAIEGELKKMASSEIVERLRPIEVRYRIAESVASTTALAGLSTRQGLLLTALVVLLLLEQFLAWSASYHLPKAVVAKAAS